MKHSQATDSLVREARREVSDDRKVSALNTPTCAPNNGKRLASFPSGWWLLPAVAIGAFVWVKAIIALL